MDSTAARQTQLIQHLTYLQGLAPVDFFLFPMTKRELASLTQNTFEKQREGAVCKPPLRQTSPRLSGESNSAVKVTEL
jgi:hypothetical protein